MRNGKDVDSELMKKMNEKLSHRGPDGSKTWVNDNVGLGHQMLWTTPESLHEELPFEEDDLVITSDARIDNRDELSEKLGIRDEEDVSDSYFILKAYEKWGDDCPDKLLGDFAFAIWDKKEEKLFCARDHMGVKPFYYYLDDDMFVFGTEIKALFCVEGVPREINELKVALYLIKDTFDKKNTFYKNIRILKAAYLSIISANEIKNRVYWKLNPKLQIKMNSEEDYANAFCEIFSKALVCRLRSQLPLGSELSGGLDSSSIVCMSQKILNETYFKKINTFSRIFDETPESDERYYIKKVIDKYEINSHLINVDNISPLKNINDILYYQDQPFYTPHITKQIKSYKKVQENNVRVLLSGHGGDEIVSKGKNYLQELAVTRQFNKLGKEIKGLSNNLNKNKFNLLITRIIFPQTPYCLKKIMLYILGSEKNFILNKDFLKKLGLSEEIQIRRLDCLNKKTAKEYQYYNINYGYHETVFGTIDRRVAPFNIEMRYPFFDKRIVEFCYGIPTGMKMKNGWDRYILRISMENILPKEIQWRKHKTDLSPSYKKNLMKYNKNTLRRIIYVRNNPIQEYLDLNKIKYIFKKNEFKTSFFDLWLIILLYFWIKINFENDNLNDI
jgi:asparagine synthase (glutamine-hydrolysing)